MTFGDAREVAAAWAQARVDSRPGDQLVLVWDPAARLRVVVKFDPPTDRPALEAAMQAELEGAVGTFFSGDILVHGSKDKKASGVDHVFDTAWRLAHELPETGGAVRLLDRRRGKASWYAPATAPWSVTEGPAIVTFASYKGGFGRSTALAATAVGFAEEGLRVLVVDLDLEAPGLWSLLPPQHAGDTIPAPESGLVDVLLDPDEVGSAVYPASFPGIDVLPAGAVDDSYLEKLARIDYEALVIGGSADGPLPRALDALRDRDYDVILLDARAGLHDLTGAAINGTPHLVVLFGRDTDESWAGIELMLRRIGADRVGTPGGQQDVLLVYAKAPGQVADRSDRTFGDALASFEGEALRRMQEERAYYARAEDVGPKDEDQLVKSDNRHEPVGLLFDGDTLHGGGRTIPDDRLGYGELRDVIRERVGLAR